MNHRDNEKRPWYVVVIDALGALSRTAQVVIEVLKAGELWPRS